jgi:deoxyribodipyrimidine photo-lyase
MSVESERIRKLNDAPDRPEKAQYVLYWAQMNRRMESNHALLFAVELANKQNLPVLFYEAITCTYEYANDRLHTFMLEAVPETARRLNKAGIGYAFYLRKTPRSPNNTFYRLAAHAAAVVTDDYPAFIARTHNSSVPQKLEVAYYVVDSSCIVPMSVIPSRQYGAYTIRPKINRVLERYLKPADEIKVKHRFKAELPEFHVEVTPQNIAKLVAECEIDHHVKPSAVNTGGRIAAEKRLGHFLTENLRRYAAGRNEPAARSTSGMSPYLHFGQIASLEVALAVKSYAEQHKLLAAEYLEELIVRRELAFNYARFVEDPGDLANLPDWCQKNMRAHAKDPRDPLYTLKQLENAETYDELWNATQKEMLITGAIHGYYRMYWGKKIIEWTRSYEQASKFMIDIHGKYSLDGRDPATYTNILWCLGLHDRPWPARPVFGTFRFMSLEGMKRKSNTRAYIEQINSLKA